MSLDAVGIMKRFHSMFHFKRIRLKKALEKGGALSVGALSVCETEIGSLNEEDQRGD